MNRPDRLTGTVFMAFGLLVSVGAAELGAGTWRQPGPGFFPLAIGLALAGLGGALALPRRPGATEDRARTPGAAGPATPRKLGGAVLLLAAYGLLLERLGFLVATVAFVALWLRGLERSRWSETLLVALGAAAVAFGLFVRWLQVPLPPGVLSR